MIYESLKNSNSLMFFFLAQSVRFHTHVTKDLRLVGGFIYINLRVVVGVVP